MVLKSVYSISPLEQTTPSHTPLNYGSPTVFLVSSRKYLILTWQVRRQQGERRLLLPGFCLPLFQKSI